jgi:hypothetical protein
MISSLIARIFENPGPVGSQPNNSVGSQPSNNDGVILNIGEEAQGVLPYSDKVANSPDGKGGLTFLITNLLEAALVIAGLLLLLYLIWGAIEWITSEGDTSKLESARNRITQAVIGMIVLSAVIAIFKLVQGFLNITIINFI